MAWIRPQNKTTFHIITPLVDLCHSTYILFLNLCPAVYSPSCGLHALSVLSSTIQTHDNCFNSVLRKSDQLPAFPHQRKLNPKPHVYQTDASDDFATFQLMILIQFHSTTNMY